MESKIPGKLSQLAACPFLIIMHPEKAHDNTSQNMAESLPEGSSSSRLLS